MSKLFSMGVRTALAMAVMTQTALAFGGVGATEQVTNPAAPVPEPGATVVFGAGAVLIGIAMRRGRR